jgi:hypothetical protein
MQPTYGDNWFREQQLAAGLTDHKARCCRRDGAVAPAGCPEYATVFRSAVQDNQQTFFAFFDTGSLSMVADTGTLVSFPAGVVDIASVEVQDSGTDGIRVTINTDVANFFAPLTGGETVNLYNHDTGELIGSTPVVQQTATQLRQVISPVPLMVEGVTYRVELCGMVPA